MRINYRRTAFTLTEMLVAITIMMILAAMAIAVLPTLGKQERAARGTDRLQRMLMIAKQRAVADHTPNGVRLIVTDTVNRFVTELQYLYQPEPYSRGQFLSGGPSGQPAPQDNQSTFSNTAPNDAQFDGGGLGLNTPESPVQVGDYLELYGGGLVTRITGVPSNYQLYHQSPMPTTGPTANYRIIRQPRVLQGEPPFRMPQDIAIDLNRCLGLPPLRTIGGNQTYDIMFAPTGAVVGQGATSDRIILYVRDVTVDNDALGLSTRGNPAMVVIYTGTGLIGAHPVDNANLISTTASTDPPAPGTNVSFDVANPAGITVGMNLLLEPWTPQAELQRVTAVSGSTVTFERVKFDHATGIAVISDIYSFSRNPRASGM